MELLVSSRNMFLMWNNNKHKKLLIGWFAKIRVAGKIID